MYKFIITMVLSSVASAATITNNIQGMGNNNSIKPYICIQNSSGTVTLKLSPGQSGDANKASGNLYYAGATLRFDGCDESNSYLGYVGFSINDSGNNSISAYTPPAGVHIKFDSPSIDRNGKVGGKITYTPIAANLNFTKAHAPKYWNFAGFNLSGLEFGKTISPFVIPNLSEQDKAGSTSDLKDTEFFIKEGMNTVRLPISWGFLQLDGAGKGGINLDYYNNFVRPLLETLTQANVYTIIDLHAYMRYSKYGEQYSGCGEVGPCPDGTLVLDEKAYQSIWGQLIKLIQDTPNVNQNYLLLDLMNEPVEVPDDKVFTIQASLIKYLRNQGFDGYILVEGNSWSGLHSWGTAQWQGKDGKKYTNETLFTRDNFNRAGINDLSKVIINVHQYLDSDYSGTHDNCLQNLTTTGPKGFNLQDFVDYLEDNRLKAIVTEFGTGRNADSCRGPLHQFMQYLQQNSAQDKDYGFIGWTVWSTGHGWGNYNLRMTPTSYQYKVIDDFIFPANN